MEKITHLTMQLDSLDGLPENHLQAGYEFRDCTWETAEDYEWIINHSFEGEEHFWEKEVLEKEGYQPGNTTIIYSKEGPAATATAICQEGGKQGYLHMVGALPKHSGKRLGYEVSLHALHKMRSKGMTSCKLDTDDFRLPAIVTYFKLGFHPAPEDEEEKERWRQVLKILQMPDLMENSTAGCAKNNQE